MRKRQRALEERDEEEEVDQRGEEREKGEESIVTSSGHINLFSDLQTGVRTPPAC